jgi:ADP-glucose pyrophosphorylase
MNSPDKILAVILGGGRGTRLHPLTQQRSKPAMPIAGKYRLIDISISNCINSGINHIGVLTQFNSVSLNRHIANSINLTPSIQVGCRFGQPNKRYTPRTGIRELRMRYGSISMKYELPKPHMC